MIADPGRVNLRKAVRAAIVTPVLFALALVVFDNDDMALFASFGSFAALVFGDFGGTMQGRFRAYLALLVAGGGLVALGTALSNTTLAAIIVMFVVGFVIVFLGALGGYFAASGVATVLAFVLAVMVPGPDSSVPDRLLGWLLGVGSAMAAALVLWPVQERRVVRVACADLADAIAQALRQPGADALAAVARAEDTLRQRTGSVVRPAGNAARDRALVSLVHELHLARRFVDQLPDDDTPTALAVRWEAASTLETAAAGVRSPAATVDVSALVRARAVHTGALEEWTRTSAAGSPRDAAAVVERFDDVFPLRALSLRVLAVAVDVAAITGARVVGLDAAHDHAPADVSFLAPLAATVPVGATLREHFDPRSVRFRAALRAGIGLAAAVGIAKAFDLDHAFWVVLGTLSVLRSNALGTGVTGLQAVSGTLIGFAIATVGIVVVGGDHVALWIALPITVFLSAYTPGAVHFVVGQACFTVFVVVLFNLIEPEGWRTGLVRVEDIAIGVSISLLVGVVLWPRGAREAAVANFALMLRDGAAFARAALGAIVGGAPALAPDVTEVRDAALASRARAISALEDLTVERGGGHVERESWVSLLAISSSLLLAGNGMVRLARDPAAPGCDEARRQLADGGDALAASVERLAARLSQPALSPPASLDAPATTGLCSCVLERAQADDSPTTFLWTREFLALVDERVASFGS